MRAAAVAQFGIVNKLQIDDLDANAAAATKQALVDVDNGGRTGDIEPGEIEHAALGSEGVLHIDDDQRRFCRIDLDRSWARR